MDQLRERVEALEHQLRTLRQQSHAVHRRLRWWRGLACGFLLLSPLTWALPSGKAQYNRGDLEQRVADLEYKLEYVSGGDNEVVITGANLRIVNGLGETTTTNGLGNLIVGYNEPRPAVLETIRTGSHNVVVGPEHNFSRFGGLVVGLRSEISGNFSSVSGGDNNTASGNFASISGGGNNRASGEASSVSGGASNRASGDQSWVSGGFGNTASRIRSSVSGGLFNTASGEASSVSGGSDRTAAGEFDWVAGPLFADE